MNLSKTLKQIRIRHKLTQLQLSNKLNISRSYISEIEKGIKTPSYDVLKKYSNEFKVPVSIIFLFSEDWFDDIQKSNPRYMVANLYPYYSIFL